MMNFMIFIEYSSAFNFKLLSINLVIGCLKNYFFGPEFLIIRSLQTIVKRVYIEEIANYAIIY